MKTLSVIVASLVLATTASAQVVFSPGVGYYSSSTEQSTPSAVDSEVSETRFDLRLGYVLPMGLYIGGMYSHMSTKSCSGACDDTSGFLMGPSIGYQSMMGFYTILTYHIMGERGDETKLTGGKGPQADIGWVFPLSSYFSIGPQLTWRSIEYDKLEGSGTTLDTDRKESSIAPYVSLWFMF